MPHKKRRPVPKLRVLGTMTGTSCDGLDAACIEFTPTNWSLLWSSSLGYPKELREKVLAVQKPGTQYSTQNWLSLNRDLGDWYGKSLEKLLRNKKDIPDVIASHGQTIAHFPASGSKGTTLQMGDASRIAVHTGLTVASQFREGDMAAGGQGAPLVPLFHRLLAQSFGPKGFKLNQGGVAFHNLGGIGNLTYLGPKGQIVAFDTGPANLWIDAAMEYTTQGKLKYDVDGKSAALGTVDVKALNEVLALPYFSKSIPKSTGRDEFPFEVLLSKTYAKGNSLVATASEVAVESIARAYEVWIVQKNLPLRTIYLCGGGAKNKTLILRLRARLPYIQILSLEEVGFDPQTVEAQAFSLYGFLALFGFPIGGKWTGTHSYGPPAHLIPGENWTEVLSKMSSFSKSSPIFRQIRSRS